MDPLLSAHNTLEKKANLTKTLTSVQTLLSQLQATRDAVASDPAQTSLHLAKLKQPLKASFEKIEEDLKEVNKGLNQYQKALKEKFKNAQLPANASGGQGLGDGEWLVNRAVAMHLLREGKFGVARTFVREVNERAALDEEDREGDREDEEGDGGEMRRKAEEAWRQDFSDPEAMEVELDSSNGHLALEREDGEVMEGKGSLQRRFAEMYLVLDALQNDHNLEPAIAWAREHSTELEARGSNLEFELCRLKFAELYTTTSPDFSGPIRAITYARETFPSFVPRYNAQIATLMGSLAFSPNLEASPYNPLFTSTTTLPNITQAFTREFTTLLGLASSSPLYTALTAGSIALPVLQKYTRIITTTKGSWTSANELPVETPLPPGMVYHSIFVCPVSKEQGTDANWPVMLPCGHVVARESLEMHARGKSRVKCPYCPLECGVRDGRRIYI